MALTISKVRQASTNAVNRLITDKLNETVSVKDFGAVGNGVVDDTVAIQRALDSGAGEILFPSGTYLISKTAHTVWDGLSNVTLRGMRNTKIKLHSYNLYLRSPTNVVFNDIAFEGPYTDGVNRAMWVTNFNDIKFIDCAFSGFGGLSTNVSGSCSLTLTATDTSTAYEAAGNSETALVQNCVFDGNDRNTNFAIRIFTAFTATSTSTLTDVKVSNSTFNEFNWNAVELGGRTTYNCIISDCTANRCGLTPFDIDKGVHNCMVTDCTVNRLLGNKDYLSNPGTRACVVEIQGIDATGFYTTNCTVQNITARLLAADIAAYRGIGGMAAASIAYAQNCSIRNINVSCDVVPSSPVTNTAFIVGTSYVSSGCTIENVLTTNATHGLIETETNNAAVGSIPNIYRNINNQGTMTGECISFTADAGVVSIYHFDQIVMKTNMSAPYIAGETAMVSIASTATGAASYEIVNSSFTSTVAAKYGAAFNAVRMGIHNTNFGVTNTADVFKPASTGIRLHFGSNFVNNDSASAATVFTNVAATCAVYQNLLNNFMGNSAYPLERNCLCEWVGDTAPANPPYAFFRGGSTIHYTNPVSGAATGLIRTTSGWKGYANAA